VLAGAIRRVDGRTVGVSGVDVAPVARVAGVTAGRGSVEVGRVAAVTAVGVGVGAAGVAAVGGGGIVDVRVGRLRDDGGARPICRRWSVRTCWGLATTGRPVRRPVLASPRVAVRWIVAARGRLSHKRPDGRCRA
jgi:hypothetical protein